MTRVKVVAAMLGAVSIFGLVWWSLPLWVERFVGIPTGTVILIGVAMVPVCLMGLVIAYLILADRC